MTKIISHVVAFELPLPICIAHDNLKQYPEDEPPVNVIDKESDTNKIVEAKSVFDMHSQEGIDSGDCPFIVHTLTGEQYNAKLPNMLKAIVLWNSLLSYLISSYQPCLSHLIK